MDFHNSKTYNCVFLQALLEKVVKDMKATVDVLWLEGGSHGLAVRGRSEDSVLDEVNSQVFTWTMKQGAHGNDHN